MELFFLQAHNISTDKRVALILVAIAPVEPAASVIISACLSVSDVLFAYIKIRIGQAQVGLICVLNNCD